MALPSRSLILPAEWRRRVGPVVFGKLVNAPHDIVGPAVHQEDGAAAAFSLHAGSRTGSALFFAGVGRFIFVVAFWLGLVKVREGLLKGLTQVIGENGVGRLGIGDYLQTPPAVSCCARY